MLRFYALLAFSTLGIYFFWRMGVSRSRSAALERLGKHTGEPEPVGTSWTARIVRRLEQGRRITDLRRALSACGFSGKTVLTVFLLPFALLPALALAVTGSVVSVPFAAALAFFLPRFITAWLSKKESAKLADQCDALAADLALLLRSGIPVGEALMICALNSEPPLAPMLEASSIFGGGGAELFLIKLAESLNSPDLQLIGHAARTSVETGADVQAVMDAIGEAVRERAAVKRELATQTIQGRLSGRVVAGLPLVFLLLSVIGSRSSLSILFGSLPGIIMLAVAAGLEALGFIWIRRIMDIKV